MNIADAQACLDETIAERVLPKTASLGRPITCRGAGCFGCCKEPVLVSRVEAAYIVEGLTPEQREHCATQTQRWLTMVRASGLLAEPEPHVLLWRMVQAWCPLLRDGQCVAYARRPVSCRLHLAIGNPDYCHDDKLRRKQTYCECPEVSALAMVGEIEDAGKIEFDHLGVWLAEMLLGKQVKSGARWSMSGTFEASTGHLTMNLGDKPVLGPGATRLAATL